MDHQFTTNVRALYKENKLNLSLVSSNYIPARCDFNEFTINYIQLEYHKKFSNLWLVFIVLSLHLSQLPYLENTTSVMFAIFSAEQASGAWKISFSFPHESGFFDPLQHLQYSEPISGGKRIKMLTHDRRTFLVTATVPLLWHKDLFALFMDHWSMLLIVPWKIAFS